MRFANNFHSWLRHSWPKNRYSRWLMHYSLYLQFGHSDLWYFMAKTSRKSSVNLIICQFLVLRSATFGTYVQTFTNCRLSRIDECSDRITNDNYLYNKDALEKMTAWPMLSVKRILWWFRIKPSFTTGWHGEYLQGTLEHHCHNSWNCPTLEWHWRNSDYCSLH